MQKGKPISSPGDKAVMTNALFTSCKLSPSLVSLLAMIVSGLQRGESSENEGRKPPLKNIFLGQQAKYQQNGTHWHVNSLLNARPPTLLATF